MHPETAHTAASVAEQKRALLKRKLAQAAMTAYPLSHGQQALWFLHTMVPDSAAYNIAFAVRIRSSLDVEKLRQAFQTLIGRHAALRTTFSLKDGEPVQVVHGHKEFSLEQIDAAGWDVQQLHQQVVGAYRRPFNLEAGPLLRAYLFQLDERDCVLLLSAHHIIGDGWSLWMLLDEWRTLYELDAGESAGFAPLKLNYTDHVRRQQDMLAGPRGAALRAYWQRQLAGELPALSLPVDHARPAQLSYRGASWTFRLAPQLTQGVKALAKAEGVTLYTLLLAAYQVLLYRYSHQERILVGSPMAGRMENDLTGVVGYFVNPVVLSADLSAALTFKQLLVQARERVLGALAHQDYPFSLLVEQLQLERDGSRNPLFQAAFMLQKSQQSDEFIGLMSSAQGSKRLEWKNLSLEPYELMQQEGQFDLTLEMADAGDALVGVLKYSTDLFDAATIERMAGHLTRLLEAVVAEPGMRVADLPLLPDAERRQLLLDWNDTARAYPQDTLHGMVEAQAARTPDRVAVAFDGVELSYAELNGRANQLAGHLRDIGVTTETLVGVCLERSLDLVVALLGILKAGGAYVPLDPAYPSARLAYMLEHAHPRVLLTQDSLLKGLPACSAQLFCMDRDWPMAAQHAGGNPKYPVEGEHIAYVIYTSGSTGKPKGVQVPHRGVVNFLHTMRETPGVAADDVVLNVTSLSFDIAVLEVFLPLVSGARTVLCPGAVANDPQQLAALIERAQVTVMQATPVTWRMLAEHGWPRQGHQLKVLCGGEALPIDLARQLLTHVPAVWNMYGPTETTVWSTLQCLKPNAATLSIGHPIANTRIYVLDEHLNPVPIGVAGELHIAGEGVARGYLHRPDLTGERFIPDPFSAAGGRMYKTGDLARYLPDGAIECLGRMDHQVKIRGFRIELGEIETALTALGGVREAVVLAREDAPGEQRLVAYLVAHEDTLDSVADTARLRAALARTLPDYMIPAHFVLLPRMPLTPNGKVERKALPAPDLASSELAYVGPRTPEEEILAGIWAEVLQRGEHEQIGVHEHFFHIGGHSLLATQVMAKLRAAFQLELPLRALFDATTIETLAQRIVQARQEQGAGGVPAIAPADRNAPLALSFGQQRLWFLDQFESGSALYNLPAAVRLSGSLDGDALERSLNEIVRRHEALRTRFASVDGNPRQIIAAAAGACALAHTDLSGLPHAEREAKARWLAQDEAQTPFDLDGGALLRARLIRLEPAQHIVLLTMHHIASDGWSLGVLVRELVALYTAYSQQRASPLPELAIQYADFAQWQRQYLQGEALEQQVSYWKNQLGGAPTLLTLPTDRARPASQSYRGASLPFVISQTTTAGLHALSRQARATLFMTLAAAFNVLLARHAGQSDICIGTPIANRQRAELEPLIGFFVNTLVLRTQVDGNAAFSDLLQQVRASALGAYAHQDLPFEQLVEALNPERHASHAPLFQVMLVLQNAPLSGLALPGLTLEALPGVDAPAKFDLTWNVREEGGQLLSAFEYSTDLFDATTIERMAGHLTRLLEAVVAEPDMRVADLPLLPNAERRQLLLDWNDTARAYPQDTLHGMVEAQAARTPDRVAVAFDGVELSYAELNGRANQLAGHLRDIGVTTETLVGVCLERSLDLVVALLGILKAGGAYVPLDPAYPSARLAYMLEHAQPRVLLTQDSLLKGLPACSAQLFCMDRDWPMAARHADGNPHCPVEGEHIAYVIYTSGSTGKPKGVQVPHRGVVNFLNTMRETPGVAAADVVLNVTSLSFDIAVLEVFLPLVSGARTVLCPGAVANDPQQLAALIERAQVTVMQATPVTWRMLAEHGWPRQGHQLKVLCGGEALPIDLARQLLTHVPAVWNMYGPTETTVWSTLQCLKPNAATLSIGHPIANTRIYVLDEHLNPVPIGVAGELHIAGEGVARGYLHRPDLTGERFIPDPFSAAGGRMYKTGDLARYLPDGAIECLGRMDHQVKIRGFRIELGEIETALAAQDGVREAVVLAREDAPGEQRLVAYLVTHEDMLDSVADTARLRAALAHTLPDYMIPAHFVLLPRMPLTPNGKVERKALPAPDLASSELAYVGPRTPEEEILAGIWAEVLQRGEHEQIGVHEHFFHIGGHSLLATQVMAKLRAAFQLELPLRALFDATTIETLAQRIVQARREQGAGGVPAIAPADRNAPLALSFGQQRLWFLDQFESGSALYNLPAAVRLSGSLDGDALERSLNEIVRRHEALRTRFASVDGNLRQIIAAGACALAHTDLRGLPHAEREAKARWLAQDEAQTPFDLDGGALLRARLIRLEPAQHIVLLTMHHIASDGWSLGVLVRELVALYTAYSQQQASPLPELAIQYADFAQWQRQYLQGEALEQQVSYWKNQLGGAPTLLTLPTDRARPASQSYRGASLPFVISQATTAGLHALSRQARATLFMTLAAAFNVLLARHAGQSDICIGTPIANRQRAELEPLIGFFVNTLVLRTQVDGNAAFSELLQQVRATALGAYAHQDLPFEQLVEALNPERHASHAPLFQVMLVLQNAPLSGLALPGLTLEALPAAEAPAKFDLTWNVREEGGQLLSAFEYSTDLFDATTIERMAGRLTRLLDAVVAEPDMRVADLPLLPDAERRQLLVDWNDTARVYPRDTLQGMVEAQAARTPDRVAVAFEGRELSYAELNGRANRLAHYLREQGVGPDRLVGICAERSLDMVTGLLAILKAGGAYVPLDPGYPTERLATILKDAAPVVLLGERRVLERLAHAGPAFCLDTQDTALAAYPAENPPARALPRNLAYVIYTSGSTGKPKGVGIDQAGIVNRLQWMQEAYALTAADRVLQKTPFSFDVSVWEFFWPLAHGATLVVAKPGGHQEPAYLAELIEAQGVTTLHFVPPMLDVFLQTLATPTQAARCRSLRLLICSGQALPLALQQRCLAQLPQAALHNLYGPTEASVDVTFWRCRDDAELACVPIGAPIANTQIYILDRQLNPVPAGVAGELHIGGVGLARGYLNRPDLTAAQFIPHPFSAQPGARLYKSGDLARYLPDGQIEYLGRLDHQVKLRGLRIELGEIEAALTAQDGVREAVVLAREDAPGEQRLVAYLVAHEDRPGADVADTARLRAALARTLPDYMIPAHFVLLPRMPLTPNGKVERKALPAPDLASSELAYVGPRTPEEEILAGIWAEVLQRGEHEQIGVHEHFFHIGGHSLLATQVVSKLRAAFQLELPLRALFDATTIETLAQRIVQARREQGAGVPAIAPADRNAPLALSFGQQRLWFLDQFESGGAVYNVPAAVRLSGSLDGDALERSLNEIVRRHEALRTRFASVDGNPRQIIAAAAACALAHTDLSGLPHAEREAKAGWLAQDEAQTPFDLDGGALLRARLIRLEPEQHIVLLTMHHIASDGWSLGVLVRELVALYTAYSQQRASPLPELAIQYADFAQWQRQWLQGEALEQQVSYWKNQLGGAPTLLTLPTDRARPASQSYRGASLPFVISQATTAGLHALSRQARATLFMTLAAAFNVLLARHAGQSDICIGTPIANRQRAELEPLIGFFVNTLVLRTQVDGDAAFSDLLQQVRATALGAYAHQDLPFEQLVEALNPERHASHAPLFQVMLALQNAPMSGLALPGLTIEVLPGAEAPAKFDLTWNVREEGGQLLNTFEYSTDLFDAATMQRMAGHLTRLLEAVVAEPGTRVADLPLLRDAERDQLLVAWNQTGQAYPTELCVEQLFEAQVARTPERVALSCAGVELSYAQLNQRANRVAHLLRRRGIGPGAVVGVCLERNADLIVALLAVLKAGAAYLPLDPDYPRERIAFMLDDAGVALVLAHARFQDLLSTCQAPIALVDEQLGQAEAGDNPAPLAGARDLAYVIYTSGSTGQPKGVAIEHRATVTLLHWARDTFTPEQRAGMLASTSVCFDLSVFEIFVPLSWGGRILLIENALHLPALQDKSALTFINTVPSAMTELVRMGQVPASVKVVGLAGEPLQNALVQSIYQAGVDSVYNLYGPSEDTTYSTFVRLERGSTQAVSIGRPIANTRLYILDARMEPVPLGVAGELYIGGDGLARGYLHRAELTREKFIADPFSADPAARLYKTGDLVRYRADGQVDFLGRLDHQVKLRGYRIELGDIEAALLAHGQVREAVLQVREDQPGDRRLVAYLVAATAEAPGAAELRAFLQDKLPGYMIPSAFVPLPRMPLTPNGKIDRKALPAPQGAALASAAQYLAPASATEKQVAAVWQTVLGVERVGVHDNFFDLGGHSLLAIQLVARLRDAVSIDIPLHTLFQAPGLAEFSQRIDTLRAQAGGRVSAIPRVSRDAPLPLSFAQQGVWFMHRFEGANPAYSMPAAIRLEGHLDTALLQLAFNEIIRRHEVLRTTFPEVDGQATQKVGVAFNLDIPLVDLSGRHVDAAQDAMRQAMKQLALHRFDLATGPLIQVALFRLGAREHVLFLNPHHIVFDGWSMHILIREMGALYQALLENKASPLPELPIQYGDFAHWQRTCLQGEEWASQLQYWQRQLAHAPVLLALPTDRPRPEVQTFESSMVHFEVSAELLTRLKHISQQAGVTLFMTLLSAFGTLLSVYSRQSDIVIGSPIANRVRTEVESLIGFFVNTLVLRIDLAGDPLFMTLLERVKRVTLEAYAHQDVPFEKLVDVLRPQRSVSHTPIFQVWFNYQSNVDVNLTLPDLQMTPLYLDETVAKFDVMLNLTETGSTLAGSLACNAQLFDAYTVTQLSVMFGISLEEIANRTELAVSELGAALDNKMRVINAEKNTQLASADRELLHGLINKRRNKQTVVKK